MKYIILAFAMVFSVSVFAAKKSNFKTGYAVHVKCWDKGKNSENQICGLVNEKYTEGTYLKCWETGRHSDGPKRCGWVHERAYFTAASAPDKDLNKDGKISAYERMMYQSKLNENGGR